MSDWKGGEALNTSDDSKAFWDLVGEPAKVEDVEVGEAVRIEQAGRRWVAIVREKWIDGHGNTQIRFTDPKQGEKFDPPTLTILAEMRKS